MPHPSTVPDTFMLSPGYVGSSSSHMSSNLIITPVISPAPSQLMPTWVRSPTSTIASGVTNDMTFEKHTDYVNMQPQNFTSFQSSQSSMLPLASPTMFTSPAPPSISDSIPSGRKHSHASAPTESVLPFVKQIPTAEAMLHSLSVGDEGEQSSKRMKKGKEHSTQAALVSIQGSMSFLGLVISSSSLVAAQKLCTKKMQAALDMVEEHDQDLPIEVNPS
ncbi:hypothetical protein BKA83DRAFT_4500589 [Pisolithus microcarpus]|nr:hypothetical protein BKA83DRAFT_4500589 [Pisolithus microcarpus]